MEVMMNRVEEWKAIPGFEGLYEVSNAGNVRSFSQAKRGGLLALIPNEFGYLTVSVWKDGKQKNCRVHRLVAEAFLVKPYGKDVVNHKDGNVTNNKVDNLEWCTQAENLAHAIKTGLRKTINLSSNELYDLYVTQGKTGVEIGQMYGVTKYTIYHWLKRYGIPARDGKFQSKKRKER
jgi:hypothetical protein